MKLDQSHQSQMRRDKKTESRMAGTGEDKKGPPNLCCHKTRKSHNNPTQLETPNHLYDYVYAYAYAMLTLVNSHNQP